jgi:hypothetical protein
MESEGARRGERMVYMWVMLLVFALPLLLFASNEAKEKPCAEDGLMKADLESVAILLALAIAVVAALASAPALQ